MKHHGQVNEAPAGSIVACAISSMEGSELGNLVNVGMPYMEHLGMVSRLGDWFNLLLFVGWLLLEGESAVFFFPKMLEIASLLRVNHLYAYNCVLCISMAPNY